MAENTEPDINEVKPGDPLYPDLPTELTPSTIEQLNLYLRDMDPDAIPNLPPPSNPAPVVQVPIPEMELEVVNRMIRLRYDSELSNRNKGKEELIRVVIKNYTGPIWIRMQTVDIRNHKSHPFCLIGDSCNEGIYYKEFQVDPKSTCSCVCKATLRIPRKTEYEKVLQNKYKFYKDNPFNIVQNQMMGGDYWTCNKSIKECTDFRLHVETFYKIGDNYHFLEQVSEPLSNAKDGKKFDIHRLCPYSIPATGILQMQHSLALNITKAKRQWVIDHLGHTMNVHQVHYRQTSDVLERIDVAKILLIQYLGLVAKYKGIKLDEINLEEIAENAEQIPAGASGDATEPVFDNSIFRGQYQPEVDEDYIPEVPNEVESDGDDDYDFPATKKKKRRPQDSPTVRQRWTNEEIEELKELYKSDFETNTTPGQKRIETMISKSMKNKGFIYKRKRDTIKKKTE